MLKMSSVSCNAGLQSHAPFFDCTVDHSLIKTVPILGADLPHPLSGFCKCGPAESATHNQLDLDGHSEGGMKSVCL